MRLQQVETKQTSEWLGRLCRTLDVPLSDPRYKRSTRKRQRMDSALACSTMEDTVVLVDHTFGLLRQQHHFGVEIVHCALCVIPGERT